MKARAAVLYTVGAPQPCGQSRPLRIEEIDIDPPGPRGGLPSGRVVRRVVSP